MSSQNLIERAGRGVSSLLTGDPAAPSSSQQRERGNALIGKLGMGGVMLGGGAAAVVAAVNLLSSLDQERKLEDDAKLDDDTLYIDDPRARLRKKAAEGVSPLLAPGLAITSAIVGAGGAYALVQSVHNAAEKRRRQALLDEAQRETLTAADQEVSKLAAAADPRVNLGDLLTATPVALPLLTMLATGGITYAALHKQFPTISRQKRTGPKRIRVMRDGAVTPYDAPDEDVPDEVTGTKQAAFGLQDLDDAGSEFLASFVAASRARTIIGDMINKSASGGLGEMEELLKVAGVGALLTSLKGVPAPSQDLRMLGSMALFKSAALSATARAIAVAEYLEIHGSTFDEIAGDHAHMSKLASLGCLLGIISRDSALPELAKQAALMPRETPPNSGGILEALKALLSGAAPQAGPPAQQGGTHQQREDRDAALTSDVGGGVAGASEDGADGAQAARESTGDDDVIDSIMATGQPEAVMAPSA